MQCHPGQLRKMRNIAHKKKLNGCSETSHGHAMTSIPNGNRDGEREPTLFIPSLLKRAVPTTIITPAVSLSNWGELEINMRRSKRTM